MNLQELKLNELDLENIGIWPIQIKALLVLLLCTLLGVGWYYMDTHEQLSHLKQVEQKEQDLRQDFEVKQAHAVNLEPYKRQLEEMRESFGDMLSQLPNKTEVANLLVDVSQTGLAAGLEFELVDPAGEVPREFYAELPIKLKVKGRYHEFGVFISGLAALPRIVTVHNVKIYPHGKSRVSTTDGVLTLEAVAKTYRYLDEESDQ